MLILIFILKNLFGVGFKYTKLGGTKYTHLKYLYIIYTNITKDIFNLSFLYEFLNHIYSPHNNFL